MAEKESVYYDSIPIYRQNKSLLEIDSILKVNTIYALNTPLSIVSGSGILVT